MDCGVAQQLFVYIINIPGNAKAIYDHMCVSCHGCCQSMIKQGIFQYLERKNKQKIEVKALSPGEIETELEVKVKEEKRTNTIKQLSAPLHVGNLDNAVK
eukprot:1060415_1